MILGDCHPCTGIVPMLKRCVTVFHFKCWAEVDLLCKRASMPILPMREPPFHLQGVWSSDRWATLCARSQPASSQGHSFLKTQRLAWNLILWAREKAVEADVFPDRTAQGQTWERATQDADQTGGGMSAGAQVCGTCHAPSEAERGSEIHGVFRFSFQSMSSVIQKSTVSSL